MQVWKEAGALNKIPLRVLSFSSPPPFPFINSFKVSGAFFFVLFELMKSIFCCGSYSFSFFNKKFSFTTRARFIYKKHFKPRLFTSQKEKKKKKKKKKKKMKETEMETETRKRKRRRECLKWLMQMRQGRHLQDLLLFCEEEEERTGVAN